MLHAVLCMQAAAWVLLCAVHANAQAYTPGVTDYNYTQIAKPAALSRSTLNYTDKAGANLTVCTSAN